MSNTTAYPVYDPTNGTAPNYIVPKTYADQSANTAIAEMQERLDKQEKFIAEIITWLKEYFPNMGYTPELREDEWKVLLGNIQLISKGKKPKRREEIEEEKEKAEEK